MVWFNRTGATGLSSSNKIMIEQSGATRVAELEDIENLITGTDSEIVYGYMDTPVNTVMALEDRWYLLQGGFTNSLLSGFTVDANGIAYTGSGSKFEAEAKTGGNANRTCVIKIALVKNGTFVSGLLDSGDSILAGSGGLDECTTVSAASGFGNPHGLWAGALETGDVISIVMSSSVANTTWTPIGGTASIHRFN